MSSGRAKDILFFASGPIGDCLIMVAVCDELLRLEPERSITIVARRNASIIRHLFAAYPSIRVRAFSNAPGDIARMVWLALRKPYVVPMPTAFGRRSLLNVRSLFLLLKYRPGTETYGLLKPGDTGRAFQKAMPYVFPITYLDNLRRLVRFAGLQVEEEGAPLSIKLRTSCPQEFETQDPSYLVVHPFPSNPGKGLPMRRWRDLIRKLAAAYPDRHIYVTGSKENAQDAARLVEGAPFATACIGLPILEVAGILRHAALFVGVDTGITHLACVQRCPSVVVENFSNPTWWPTYNPNATILVEKANCLCTGEKGGECGITEEGIRYLRCVYDITDEMILAAAEAALPA